MIPLNTQEEFETLWTDKKSSGIFLVQFTASWCGPCKRLDKTAIEATATELGVPYYVCDVDTNNYTPGFCEVKSIPTFLLLKPSQVLGRVSESDTVKVCKWISDTVNKAK